jgi:hypothetical protein
MMKWIISIVISVLAITPKILPAVPKQILSDLAGTRQFQKLQTKHALPPTIRRELARCFKQKSLDLADAGMPFAQTDFAVRRADKPLLPTRRLLFAFGTQRHFVVYYESNAVGLGANALIFRILPAGDARFLWGGVEPDYANLAKSPRHLVDRLRREKLIDNQPFMW